MDSVGVLFDSVYNNTGDKAIGDIVVERYTAMGVAVTTVDPFNVRREEHPVWSIGGGQLIRPDDGGYYDAFRVPGRQILNAVGLVGDKGFDYLREYAYVSVRSRREQEILSRTVENVALVPCPSVLMQGAPYDLRPDQQGGIGIHFGPLALAQYPEVLPALAAVNAPKILVPFTLYAQDTSLMSRAVWDSSFTLLDELLPAEVFSAIGQLAMLVTSSLHATMFAYLQNVPVIALYQEGFSDPKLRDFLEDRGLQGRLVTTTEEVATMVRSTLAGEAPDVRALVHADIRAATEHFAQIGSHLKAEHPEVVSGAPRADAAWSGPGSRFPNDREEASLKTALIAQRDEVIGKFLVRSEQQTREIDQLRGRVQILEAECGRAQEERERSAEELDAVRGSLNAVLGSRWWRLRRTIDWLGRLRSKAFRTSRA